MMALSGVRKLVRHVGANSDLCLFATSSCALLLNLVEKTHVLDGDDRVIGKHGDELDLLLGKRLRLAGT